MKGVAQSTPARSTLVNNATKKKVTKMATIDEEKKKTTTIDWHSIPGCINKHIEGRSGAVAAKWEKNKVVFAGTQLSMAEKVC